MSKHFDPSRISVVALPQNYGPANMADFVDQLKFRLAQLKEFKRLEYNSGFCILKLIDGCGGETEMKLSGLYQEYASCQWEHRPFFIDKLARTTIAALQAENEIIDPKRALAKIYPVIRSKARADIFRLESELKGSGPLSQAISFPLVGDLTIQLGLDLGASVATVDQYLLDKWAVDRDAAWSRALRNLSNKSKQRFQRLSSGLFQGTWSDGFDPSRMLVPKVFQRLRIDGNPVVMLPNRDVLLVAGHRDREAIKAMMDYADVLIRAARIPLSGLLYRHDGHQWAEFTDMEPTLKLRKARSYLLAKQYDDQFSFLEHLAERKGDSYCVSKFLDVGSASMSSEPFNFTVCGVGVPMLLCRADHVSLAVKDSPEHALLSWNLFCHLLDGRMQPQAMTPERYLVSVDEPTYGLVKSIAEESPELVWISSGGDAAPHPSYSTA